MRFNVSGLLGGRVGGTRPIEVDGVALGRDGLDFREISVRGLMTRTDRTVLVEADIGGACDIECSRCLVDAELRLSVAFAEEFMPMNLGLVTRRGRAWLSDEVDDDLWIDESNVLDLAEPVLQSLSAGIPMVLLCSTDCRGLCGTCYVDLNVARCECDTIESDLRDSRLRVESVKARGSRWCELRLQQSR